MSTITAVEFQSYPQLEGTRRVVATFDDGSTAELFSFYIDELSFTERELVGLTAEQARALRHEKDVNYLRS